MPQQSIPGKIMYTGYSACTPTSPSFPSNWIFSPRVLQTVLEVLPLLSTPKSLTVNQISLFRSRAQWYRRFKSFPIRFLDIKQIRGTGQKLV